MDLNQELQYCMDKTAALMAQYLMRYVDNHGPVREVEQLKRACQVHLKANLSLETLEVAIPPKGPALKAFVVRLDDNTYDIRIAPGLDPAQKRFVIAKELFHIVLDKPEYRSIELIPHISEMTKEIPFNAGPKSPSVICEHLAEIGAMEYLLPYARRVGEAAAVQGGDFTAVAQKYCLPLVKVEQYLSPEYLEWLGPFAPSYC